MYYVYITISLKFFFVRQPCTLPKLQKPHVSTILCGKSHNIFVLLWLLLHFLMTCLLYCNCRSMVSATIRDHQRQPLQQPHAKLERPKHAKTKNLMKPVITCLFQVKTWPLCMDTRVVYRRQSSRAGAALLAVAQLQESRWHVPLARKHHFLMSVVWIWCTARERAFQFSWCMLELFFPEPCCPFVRVLQSIFLDGKLWSFVYRIMYTKSWLVQGHGFAHLRVYLHGWNCNAVCDLQKGTWNMFGIQGCASLSWNMFSKWTCAGPLSLSLSLSPSLPPSLARSLARSLSLSLSLSLALSLSPSLPLSLSRV